MLFFEERGKQENPEKNLSEQSKEPTTNFTHIWPRVRNRVGGERIHHYTILANPTTGRVILLVRLKNPRIERFRTNEQVVKNRSNCEFKL